jgi:ribosomal protein L12E/L44/L45/RPP1/RPP2
MTTGSFTIENAPRDAEKLQIIGPFMLKRLMEQATEKLGVPFDQEKKAAFLRDPIDKRAKDLLELLTQLDKGGGGAPAPAPAAAAAPAEEAPPPRQPRPAKANGVATNGAATHAAGSETEGMAILQGIAAVIKEVSGSIDAMQKTVAQVEKGTKRMETIEAKLEQIHRLQHLTLGVLAQMAEGSLGAPFADILAQVASEYGVIEPQVTKLVAGK